MKKEKIFIPKIGGAGLVQSKDCLDRLIKKILEDSKDGKIIFVVSALAGVTRLLGEIYRAIEESHSREEIKGLVNSLKKIHLDAVDRLDLADDEFLRSAILELDNELSNVIDLGLMSSQKHALMLAFGERYSSIIFITFLKKYNQDCSLLDARNFIVGEGDNFVNAKPIMKLTLDHIENYFNPLPNKIIVTQGYICSSIKRRTMVMGFDASDLTAAILALYFLEKGDSVELNYWKDVLGVVKDPKNLGGEVFTEMSFIEYANFSINNTVPVRRDAFTLFLTGDSKMLEVRIRSFTNIENPGTLLKKRDLID